MSTADLTATAVRQWSARDCLLALRDAGTPMTVAQIAAGTGLSRPTVDSVLQDLVAAGTARSSPAQSSGPGRPARRFIFEPAAVVAGIDLGARSLRCTVTDAAGHARVQKVVPAQASGGANWLAAVVEAVRAGCAEFAAHIHPHSRQTDQSPMPAALGVAVPGTLTAGGRIAQSLAIPELVGVDIGAELASRLNCPVSVENDIKLAAYAEHHLRPSAASIAFLQLGHRISVALIVEGKILQGSHRLAGELGTQRGMRWTQTSQRGRLRWSTGDEAKPLFARAAGGDQDAASEIEGFCAEIAPKIAALLLTIDPELVVVGGGLSLAGRTLLDPLRRHVQHLLMSTQKPELALAQLTTDGAVTGALGLVFEERSAAILGVPAVPPPWQHLHPAPMPSTP